MRYWMWKITVAFMYVIACVIILAAIFGAALKEFTPLINKHKSAAEQYASSLLHADLHIESIEASWVRFGPEVHFKGIALSEHNTNKTFVKADDLTMNIGIFRTAWRRSVYFRSLSLSGSEISIREISKQHYLINETFSVDLSDKENSQWPEFFAWLMSQNQIRFNKIHFELQQLDKSNLSLQLQKVNLYQSNKQQNQKGMSVFIEGSVFGETVDSKQKTKLFKSDVILSAWINLLQEKLIFGEVELLARDIIFQENKNLLRFPSFEGVFIWQPFKGNDDQQWLLQGKKVKLTKAPYESNDYSFELWRLREHYAAHLNSLDLEDVAVISDFFNLMPDAFNFEKAQVRGALEDIDVIIPQDFSEINSYRFSAALRDFSSVAYQQLPEIHHLSAAFSGSVSQGDFILLDENDDIYFPLYFNEPISVKTLTADGQWHFMNHELSLLLSSMHVIAPTVEAQGAMKLDIPLQSTNSARLSLVAQYNLKQSQDATRFLPMRVFDSDFSEWLTSAVGKGLGSEGKVLIRGAMDKFPYSKKEGAFIVDGSVEPLRVSFSPEWPALRNISGRLLVHNQMFGMNIASGIAAQGLPISSATVSVPDYEADDVVVNVDLQGSGEISHYLNYIQNTPLNTTLGQWLSPFQLTGSGTLSLHLGLPIEHLDNDHIKVNGSWLAQDNGFSWKAFKDERIKNIRGAIHFTQDSVSADHLSATLENEPLKINIGTEKEKNSMTAINVDVEGAFSIPEIKTIAKVNWLSFYLSGRSQFHAHLRVPMTTPEYLISFNTDLRGIHVKLPESLAKEEKTAAPFSALISLNPTKDIAQLIVNYTKNIRATIDVQHYSQEKTRTFQVDARGVAFSWPLVIDTPKSASSSSSSFWQSLTAFTVRLNHLSLYKNDFSSVIISAKRNPTGFLWKIKANEAAGQVELPFDSKQPINANFKYIMLPASKKNASISSEALTSDLSAKTAATWPPFYIEIQQLTRGKMNWGQTILQTTSIANGIKFDKISLQNKYHHIFAHGQWVNNGVKDMTFLEGEFSTENLGKFLRAGDITQSFQAKNGMIKYNLHWLGSPMKFQLKTIEGDASIDVKDGVIPLSGDSAKNGLGKVLTLFSAQSIQRRLQLNFSDLSENGYSFNTLISTVHFHDGNANVEKGAFDGPEAKINFTGSIGLTKQNYYLKLIVTPYVTSSLPLIATLAGGPIAGVATYAFDKIAAGGIAKFTSYHYLLVGPWSQPALIDLDEQAKQKAAAKQAKLDAINIAPVEEAH